MSSRALISEMTAAFASLAKKRSTSATSANRTRDLELANARSQMRIAKLERRIGDRDAQVQELVEMIRFLQERNELLLAEIDDQRLEKRAATFTDISFGQSDTIQFEVGSLALDALGLKLADSTSNNAAYQSIDRLTHSLDLNETSLLTNTFRSLADDTSLVASIEQHTMHLLIRQEQSQAEISTVTAELGDLDSQLSAAQSSLEEKSQQFAEMSGRVQEAQQRCKHAEECLAMEREEVNRVRKEASGKDAKILALTREFNKARDLELAMQTQVVRCVLRTAPSVHLDKPRFYFSQS